MIQHVYERAVASGAEDIIIATDDERVYKVAQNFGAHVCMTAVEHPSGSDRVAEVVNADQLSTEILRGCTFSCLGMTISSTPWLPLAVMCSGSAESGREKRR